VATLESGHHGDWRPAPRFAPLDGERSVAPSRVPRMPTLGIVTVTRLARRRKMRLRWRLQKAARGEDRD
jgi:hypothetical protein